MLKIKRPVMLVVLDGWGINLRKWGNPILTVRPEFYFSLLSRFPNTSLDASGEAVGLPEGQMGNSEVGHLNIGAGRIVYQQITRVNLAIKDRSFFENPVLKQVSDPLNKREHIIGLVSDGGVHSHIEHFFPLIDMSKAEELYIHVVTDGRDTSPQSGIEFIKRLEKYCAERKKGRIATICGRYYIMDRDKRWERVEKAYNLLVNGDGEPYSSASDAVTTAYKNGITDEFIKPAVIINNGKPAGLIQDGDTVFFANFRADRAREITSSLIMPDFDGFKRKISPKLATFASMTSYSEEFKVPAAFPETELKDILGSAIMEKDINQLRIAETEKYAHVTYFTNGGEEEPYEREDRILIQSPKDVATYDLKPEMSAYEVSEQLVNKIKENKYGFLMVNYANPDMVGHTGNMDAAMKAVGTIDTCLFKIISEMQNAGGYTIVTSDHGNIEQMIDYETLEPFTAHTNNKVPFILIGGENIRLREKGILADIAPTVLDLMEIPIPKAMEGESLIMK